MFFKKLFVRIEKRRKRKSIIEEFIISNKKYWNSSNIKIDNSKIILVEISEKNPFELESVMRVAKAIESLENKKINVALFSYFKTDIYYRLIKSYNVNRIILFNLILFKKLYYLFSTINDARILFSQIKSLEDIEAMRYKEIHIGDLIYDHYIRMNDSFSPKKDYKLFKLVLVAILKYKTATIIFNEYDIEYLIVGDKCYLNHGIMYRIAVERSIKTFLPLNELKVIHKDNIYTHFQHPEASFEKIKKVLENTNYEEEIEEYFEKRFSGSLNHIDVITSYKNKKIYSREEIANLFGFDMTKKNVIIMPHAFSDFPHIAEGLYSDYYVWLEKLLNYAKNIKSVNWLIKPHPTSYFFNEVGVVERMLIEFNITNIFVVPNDLNTACIKNVADVILSVRGTAGLEFGCFGIPVVNSGKGFYSGYGIAIEPNTIDEYLEVVKNIDIIEPLNDEQIKTAKMIFYYIFIRKDARLTYLLENFEENFNDYTKVLQNIVISHQQLTISDNILYKETLRVLNKDEN